MSRLFKKKKKNLDVGYFICRLTFAHTGTIHHPDERGAVFTVCGDAVLSGFEDVSIMFFYLKRAAKRVYC